MDGFCPQLPFAEDEIVIFIPDIAKCLIFFWCVVKWAFYPEYKFRSAADVHDTSYTN